MVDFVDNKGATSFEYEAIQATNRRKQQKSNQKKPVDFVLPQGKRKKAENVTQDLMDNHAIVGWAVRRHLDAVTGFYFDVDKSVDENAADRIMDLFKWHGRKENFDAARRHSRSDAFRIAEIQKVIDGDVLLAKIGNRRSPRYGSLQLIEGTRITRPKDLPESYVDIFTQHGVELDAWGGTKSFCVCKFNDRGDKLIYDRRILANQAIYSGYFDRYSSTRGVSPLLAAANQFLDIHDSMEYNLIKIKLHALFGYAVTSELMDAQTPDGLESTTAPGTDADLYDVDDARAEEQEEIDFSGGPISLDLDPGEKIQLIESNTPPESVRDYTELAIRVALLSLNIPFTMFNARHSTFAQVVADRKMYQESVTAAREQNHAMWDEYKVWKLRQWLLSGEIPGKTIDDLGDLRDTVHVRSKPSAWLDSLKEVQVEERMVALGLKSIPQVAKERGIDAYNVLEEQAAFLRKAEELDVPVYIGDPGSRSERDNAIDNEIRVEENEQSNEKPE